MHLNVYTTSGGCEAVELEVGGLCQGRELVSVSVCE